MTNPILSLINQHQSVRNYTEQPVDRSLVETIVAAGQRASTSSNLQLYLAVAVTDQDKREKLAALCGGQKHIRQAPVFIVWCADYSRMARVCQRANLEVEAGYVENLLVSAVDTALLMQTAVLAAESLGLGICYIGGIRNHMQQIIDLLNLPRFTIPISGMTLGWPAVAPNLRPRLPLESILHWEQYDTTNEDRCLTEYDQAMIDTGIYKGRQITNPAQPDQVDAYGWIEHSARRTSHQSRVDLRQTLADQGFSLK